MKQDGQIMTPYPENLQEKLAKQEQGEPVARCRVFPLRGDESIARHYIDWVNGPVAGDLYTAPQQRTWAGLTDEDVIQIRDDMTLDIRSHLDFYRHCEAKLKEKNYG